MVPYAGYDPKEGKRGYLPAAGTMRQKAYAMFLRGKDTADIAKSLKIKEHRAAEMVEAERCERRGLALPGRVER